jgi:AraC-like DNA-binding protein
MDVLSEVLRAVRLEGAMFFNGEFSAPWCFYSPETTAIIPELAPGAGRLIVYHFLTEGRAYARLPEGPREDLTAGDIVVFPHGGGHYLGNGAPERPVDAMTTFEDNLKAGLKVARYGGGGETTKFVCGYMACEPRLAEIFLAGLPKLLKVHLANENSGQWLAQSIRFSVGEENEADAGRSLVLAKLAEVLFVETLRRYINDLPVEQTGWLAGTRDPSVGQALALMHKEPANSWTLADLARRIGLSRTVLAGRFRHFMGESPMAYLTRWRLRLSAEMLRSKDSSIADVALAVGYGSEAAFNRAFRREFDCPPAQFRREHAAKPAL